MILTQEEDDDTTFTQPSTSQVQRGLEKVTPAQVDQKVTTTHTHTQAEIHSVIFNVLMKTSCLYDLQTAEVVQYFLVKDQKKMPVRRAGTAAFTVNTLCENSCVTWVRKSLL